MPVMEIAIDPIGAGEHLHEVIARAVAVVDAEGIEYELTPMGTVVQGDLARLTDLARRRHEAAAAAGVPRLVTTVRIDDHHGAGHRLRDRVEAVRRALDARRTFQAPAP